MADLHTFQAQRPRLFSMAYRMLGSASEAEDVLQDAWVRFESARNDDVRSPQAFLATIVSRLCLDRLKSARRKRETYVGPWLPEPVLTLADEEGPDVLAERSESVTLAFLVLLEALSAEERAVFLLKEVFDYEHASIAEILKISPANSRQLFHRAKSKLRRGDAANVAADDPRAAGTARTPRDSSEPSREARLVIANQFAEAFRSGNAAEFTQLLARDVGFVADGGGKVAAARRPLFGRDEVTRFLVGLNRSARALGLTARATLRVTEVNSEPAMVIYIDDQIDGVFVLSIAGRAVVNIRVVRNPEKLAYLDRQLRSVM